MSTSLSGKCLFYLVGWWSSIVDKSIRLSAIEVVLDYVSVDGLDIQFLVVC